MVERGIANNACKLKKLEEKFQIIIYFSENIYLCAAFGLVA